MGLPRSTSATSSISEVHGQGNQVVPPSTSASQNAVPRSVPRSNSAYISLSSEAEAGAGLGPYCGEYSGGLWNAQGLFHSVPSKFQKKTKSLEDSWRAKISGLFLRFMGAEASQKLSMCGSLRKATLAYGAIIKVGAGLGSGVL